MKKQRHHRHGKKNNTKRSSCGGRPEASTAANGQKSNNARHKKKSNQPSDAGADDDDIRAQLERQRQKSKASLSSADGPENATPPPPPAEPNANRTDKHAGAAPEREGDNCGDFQYDPVLKRYFPKSAFDSRGSNDACIRRIRKRIASNERAAAADGDGIDRVAPNERHYHRKENVTDDDVRRVIFRGVRPPVAKNHDANGDAGSAVRSNSGSGRKRKKKRRHSKNEMADGAHPPPNIPCSSRTTFLLATSLEYCAVARRRNAIASVLGPASVAVTARIVPSQSTLDAIRHGTKECLHSCVDNDERACYDESLTEPLRPFEGSMQYHRQSGTEQFGTEPSSSRMQRWFSMLHPLKHPRETPILQQPPWSPATPYDCECKSYLHPTAPTFDVAPPGNIGRGHGATMPYIATISNGAVYHRMPGRVRGHSAWELESFSKSVQIHGIRYAPYYAANDRSFGGEAGGESIVGCLIYDPEEDERAFTLQRTGTPDDKGTSEVEIYPLASPVNDFCFTPNSTSQHPAVAAFAHGGDANIGASFLDISTGSSFSVRENYTSHSDALCVQFRNNDDKNHVLFGHRDGCVTMIDTRSAGNALHAASLSLPAISFGSATCVRPLREDDNLVAVKGSFGSCRVFDLRRLSNNKDTSSRYQQSKVLELSLPASMVHQTKSARCTGLAIDPSESIAIAPFAAAASSDEEINVQFAVWDIGTGALLRTLNLDRLHERGRSSAFCELSSVVTPGYAMFYKKQYDSPVISSEGSSFGLWFKTNVGDAPPDGGGIHHMRF